MSFWLFSLIFVAIFLTIYGLLSLIDDDDDDDDFDYAARKRNNDTAVFISTLAVCT